MNSNAHCARVRNKPALFQVRAQSLLLSLCLLILIAAGCGGKQTDGEPYNLRNYGDVSQDLKTIPQDMSYFAKRAGGNTHLLTAAQAANELATFRTRFFAPWHMQSPAHSRKDVFWGIAAYKLDAGFTAPGKPWQAREWERIVANCNQGAYPAYIAPAITVKNISLRVMPSTKAYFRDPSQPGEGYPFDYWQNSALAVATPVLITHSSADNKWYLLETPIAAGWVQKEDVALVDAGFMQEWESAPLRAVVKENITLKTDNNKIAGRASIGTLLPSGGSTSARYPVRAPNGQAKSIRVITEGGALQSFPLCMTPNTLAMLGNQMLGQAYGWGGIDGLRDCSSMTRDIYTPFGIFLPRNSAAQQAWGESIKLNHLAAPEKEAFVANNGKPFLSIVGYPGHVGLYVGLYKGKPVMLHDIWGVRIKQPNTTREGRAVIGKIVITSLAPGRERSDIAKPYGLLESLRSLNTVANPAPQSSLPKAQPKRSTRGKR